MLFNPFIGFVAHSLRKFFAPKNYISFPIIVKESETDTLFVFKRLAKPNEKLKKVSLKLNYLK